GFDCELLRCRDRRNWSEGATGHVVGGKPTAAMQVVMGATHRFRPHDVSILIFGGIGVGRFFGCCPRKEVSIVRIGPPHSGHGASCGCGSSGLALSALMASTGMSGAARSSRRRAIFLARVWQVRKP